MLFDVLQLSFIRFCNAILVSSCCYFRYFSVTFLFSSVRPRNKRTISRSHLISATDSSNIGARREDDENDDDDDKDDPDRTDVSQALYLAAPANSREASARGGRGRGRGSDGDDSDLSYRDLSETEKEEAVAGALMEEIMDQTMNTLSKVRWEKY